MTFGNRSLTVHLARGIIGTVALIAALRGYDMIGWPALLLAGVTVWAFKGCPMCWTVGLIETAAFKILRCADPRGE
ncbi:hypothetical protein [Sphingomonas sp.]|uniref:hypothetical protein n=1 Tax=Sphingomonas sp. TaxID=28214 RepID=UPI003CC5F761